MGMDDRIRIDKLPQEPPMLSCLLMRSSTALGRTVG
jgi:hypothetical protein